MQSQAVQRLEGGRRLSGDARVGPPLVSIITVVFNAKDELQNLLNNLGAFDADEFEWIVIDGGSQDGTLEFLQERNAAIDYWLSEPDSGIYDAMNKGIAAARGEYILHLNEGDRLKLMPHRILAGCLDQYIDVASFAVMDGEEVFYPKTGFRLKLDNAWHHQGTFYRRSTHPGYDISYRIFGDLDLNQRMFKSGKTVRLFGEIISFHARDGLSMNRSDFREVYRSIRHNFGLAYVGLAFLRFKYRGLRQRGRDLAGYVKSTIRPMYR